MAGTPAAAAAKPARPGLGRAIAENVEALAIAVVMALILKYFLIEAYKIPTGSMQPEIMGDKETGIFDRVLVNKLVYLLRPPQRYEVVVFKNPLWQRQNYIKRLIGLQGERIGLRNGDIFVTPPAGRGPTGPGIDEEERIARKPDDVWEAVRKQILQEKEGKLDLAQHFVADGDAAIRGTSVTLAASGGNPAGIRTKTAVRDNYLDGYDPKWIETYMSRDPRYSGRSRWIAPATNDVTDVEFAAAVTPKEGLAALVVEIRESGRIHRATLPCSGVEGGAGEASITTDAEGAAAVEPEPDERLAKPIALAPGRTLRVDFRNVDDELVLALDGEVVLRRKYRTRGVDPSYDTRTRRDCETQVVVTATGGAVELTELGLWRDIHYLPDGNPHGSSSALYTVPDHEYMVLGDNTQNSWDCRQWEMATYKLDDGREIRGNYFVKGPYGQNPDSNPAWEGPLIHFRDIYGEEHVFPRSRVVGDAVDPPATGVHSFPEEFLLGKALAIFWPLPPFSPIWRLKWVR